MSGIPPRRAASLPDQAPPATTPTPEESDWYRDAVIYELHVRAFADSNADGIGDLTGLTRKLDYLAELGATAI